MATIDARTKDVLKIYKDTGAQKFSVQLSNFVDVDTSYSLTLKKVNQTTITKNFVVGTDLLIDAINKTVTLIFDGTIASGDYEGYLRSVNNEPDVYFNVKVEVYV